MSYNKKLPKVGGQDPIRPKFGTKVVTPPQSQDHEFKHTEQKIPMPTGTRQPPAKNSPSGK